MKMEKNKHNHKLTDLLKVGIFALLMIAPLLASVSQMLYATFNKNAYLSTQMTAEHYHVEYEFETNEVNSVDDLVIGNIYTYTIEEFSTSINIHFTTNYVHLYPYQNNNITCYMNNNYSFYMYDNSIYFYNQSLSQWFLRTYSNDTQFPLQFDFVYQGNFYAPYIDNVSKSEYIGEETIVSEPIQALDNAFYYGVDKMTQSTLFNWTENTLLYNGIKGMTDNLGVQTNAIAILITYWTILTIIYVILDIVIKGFTFITHLIVRSE